MGRRRNGANGVRVRPARKISLRSGCTRLVTLVGLMLTCVAGSAGAARGAEQCPNAASRQGPSAALPECRVYEQVTPVDKGAAIDLFPSERLAPIPNDRGYAAESGDAFLLNATSSIGANAPSGQASYVFSRGATAWNTSVVVTPAHRLQLVEAEIFDPVGLSEIGFRDQSESGANLFNGNASAFQQARMVGPPLGPYTTLSSLSGVSAPDLAEESVHSVGGSEDLSRVVLESKNHRLAPAAAGQDAGSEALYEWAGGGECGALTANCKLVDVNNEGLPLSACGATLGQGTKFDGHDGTAAPGGTHGAVSSNGSRIFFTAPDPGMAFSSEPDCWNPTNGEFPPELYMRVGGAATVPISAPEEGVEVGTPENPALPVVFVGASTTGSKVFFMTETRLTKDDTGHGPELYEYETETGKLTRISHGESGTAEGNVDFVGAVSNDGSTAYFTAFGDLAAGASALAPQTEEPFAPVNLYRYDTLTGTTTYIAAVNAGDYPLPLFGELNGWTTLVFGGTEGGRTESAGLSYEAEWYTTSDGQYLVFGTNRPITGFDNAQAPGIKCDNAPYSKATERCLELYRYAVKTNSVVCLSCVGGAPSDNAVFARAALGTPASLPPRPISENGEDVFFDSASALVPQATPGRVHVYEWHNGTLSLISAPADPGEAFFLGSSASGGDVFFSTHAQLGVAGYRRLRRHLRRSRRRWLRDSRAACVHWHRLSGRAGGPADLCDAGQRYV